MPGGRTEKDTSWRNTIHLLIIKEIFGENYGKFSLGIYREIHAMIHAEIYTRNTVKTF